jgi:hypothetical protein
MCQPEASLAAETLCFEIGDPAPGVILDPEAQVHLGIELVGGIGLDRIVGVVEGHHVGPPVA